MINRSDVNIKTVAWKLCITKKDRWKNLPSCGMMVLEKPIDENTAMAQLSGTERGRVT
jgi:hypothetical protein